MPLAKDELSKKINIGIFSAEDSQIQNSFWGQKIRREFNQREHAESERVLYVAMTRAITSVTLIAEDKKKSNKSTWFEKSVWPDIGDFKSESYSYQSIRDDRLPEVLNQSKTESLSVSAPYRPFEIPIPEGELITKYISKDIFQNLEKAKTGTELHRFFEALKYSSLKEIQDLAPAKNKKYLNFLIQQAEIPLAEILKNGFVEWGFGVQIDIFNTETQLKEKKLIQGQIDAWGFIDQTIYILDYKTGSSVYLNKAYEQLYFYAACLKEMKKISEDQKIILAVIYPVEENIFSKEVIFKDLKIT